MKFEASLIVSVYNKAQELDLVLAAVERQTFKNFEVIIADDGSREEVKEVVNYYETKNRLNISHIWQTDNGFRKNKILNKSITNSSSDYLIFIDGDCIPHKNFIEEHLKNREHFTVLCGSRVMLSNKISKNISPVSVSNGILEKLNFDLLKDSLLGRASRFEESIYIKNPMLRHWIKNRSVRLLGSNFSIDKSLLLEVNGFDERYEGPGLGEDSDLEFRLKLLGVKFKSVRNLAILFHIYHPKTSEDPKNRIIFEKTIKENRYKAISGIKQSHYNNDLAF